MTYSKGAARSANPSPTPSHPSSFRNLLAAESITGDIVIVSEKLVEVQKTNFTAPDNCYDHVSASSRAKLLRVKPSDTRPSDTILRNSL